MEKRAGIPNPVAKRLQLSLWLGQIMRDPARYNSEEFARCQTQIAETNQIIKERGIDTTALLKAMQSTIPSAIDANRRVQPAEEIALPSAQIIYLPLTPDSPEPPALAA